MRVTTNLQQKIPFLYLAAAGLIDGVSVVKKFGYNPSVGTDLATIWDGGAILYEYLTESTTLYIASTSTDDTSAGTGARTVEIIGLDSDFNEIDKTISLDGTTPVDIGEFYRVFRSIVLTAGDDGGNVGDVYIGYGTFTSGVPANILAKITAETSQTQMALYTVPAGKQAFISDYYNNVGSGKDAIVRSYVRPYGQVFQEKRVILSYENSFYFPNNIPYVFDEKTDIEIRALSSATGTAVSAGFDLMLIETDKVFGK